MVHVVGGTIKKHHSVCDDSFHVKSDILGDLSSGDDFETRGTSYCFFGPSPNLMTL